MEATVTIRVKTQGRSAARRRERRAAQWLATGAFAACATFGVRSVPSARAEGLEATAAEAADGQGQRRVLQFEIPAGPLSTVIEAFQRTTGWTVTFADDAVRSLQSGGVSGVFTPEQALRRILAGTGVAHRLTAAQTAVLDLRREESVVVTARISGVSSPKYTEPLRDVPQTITVIPASVIQEQNATTLRDVLRNVPGLTIQAGEGGVPAGDNLTIRGFSARTDMFVDGVRDFGGYSRDPFNTEQVEVTKGPASSVAGRGSTGGSINMVSKAPRVSSLRSATFGLGDESYKRGTIDVNQKLDGVGLPRAALRLNAMWTDTDVARRDAVENKRWGVAPSLAFGLGTSTRVVLSYAHLDQDNVPDYGIPWVPVNTGPLAPWSGAAPPVESSNFYGLTARDYEDTRTDLSTALVEHDLRDGLTLRNQLRYGRSKRDSVITAPRFADVNSPANYRVINRQLQSRDMLDTILSNQTSLNARFGVGRVRHALAAGVELGREGSENFLRAGPTAPTADLFDPDPDQPYPGPITRTGAVNDGTADGAAVYAFDTITLGTHFEVTGGLRYDHFAVDYDSKAASGVVTPFSRTDDMLSWRAGAVYKPRPYGSVYAGLGTSFNPSAEGLSLAANNVNLDPEETRSFEVGTKWDLSRQRLSLTAALFRTQKRNARTPGVNPGDPPQVLQGEQTVDGVELGATGSIGSRVSVFAGYAHMRSEIEESNTAAEVGGALPQTPENTFNLWLTLRLPRDVTVGLGTQYMDSVYRNAVNTLSVPSYWVVNATAAYAVTRRLTLRLNGYNLADEEYVDRVGGGHFIPGPGRYVTVTADVRF
jgi:catecholate siderophore receptor